MRRHLSLMSVVVMLAVVVRVPRAQTVDTTVPGDGSPLELVAPNGGEIYHAGDTVTVRWLAVDSLVDWMMVYLSYFDVSARVVQINPQGAIGQNDPGWEHWQWVIPSGLPQDRLFHIILGPYGFPQVSDTSNLPFVILPTGTTDTILPANGKFIEVVSPNGGETFHVGDTVPIAWRAVDFLFNCPIVWVSADDGETWENTNQMGCSPGERVDWVVPARFADSSVMIYIHDYVHQYDTIWYDYSDSSFLALPRTNVIRRTESMVPRQAGRSSLRFAVSEVGPHRIELFAVTGTRVSLHDGNRPAEYDLDTHRLPQGMYVLRITTPGHAESRPVLVTR